MDEKNLEVLRRLKEVMEREKPVEQPKKPHVPGQGFSEESEEIFRELARHKLSRPTNQKTAAAKPPKTSVPTQPPAVKKICAECKSEYPTASDRPPKRGWLCHNCRNARREKRRQKVEEKRAAQYLAAKGSKIEQLERKIAAVNTQLEQAPLERQRGMFHQLKQLERQLRLERVHKLSRFNNIRYHIVSGSYGSGKRSK